MTRIEDGKNLGEKSGRWLREVGIETVEELVAIGWEEAAFRICQADETRVNLNLFYALIGAIEEVDWRDIPPQTKSRARQMRDSLRR